MNDKNFTVTLLSQKPAEEVFDVLKNVRGWWSGLYSEEISGSSDKVSDEFTFRAGGGAHYSKQKLIELIPGKKIVWLVTDSNLSFLENKGEWTGTKISFEIFKEETKTKIVFTHAGLIPKIECYDGCSSAWANYLEKLEERLA